MRINRNAVRHSPQRNSQTRRNRVAVAGLIILFSLGSRGGNPGLEDGTASRLSPLTTCKKLLEDLLNVTNIFILANRQSIAAGN